MWWLVAVVLFLLGGIFGWWRLLLAVSLVIANTVVCRGLMLYVEWRDRRRWRRDTLRKVQDGSSNDVRRRKD